VIPGACRRHCRPDGTNVLIFNCPSNDRTWKILRDCTPIRGARLNGEESIHSFLLSIHPLSNGQWFVSLDVLT